MRETVSLNSPAKLNLFLKILWRRPDGFHEIESLFQSVDIYDTVVLKKQTSKKDTVKFNILEINPSNNTVTKAIRAFRDYLAVRGMRCGNVEAEVKKKIPPGSGLGGGSSNAAATIAGLNILFEVGLNIEEMVDIGAKVGSDVPYFFYGGLCKVSGRGEVVEPLEFSVDAEFLVAVPPLKVSTAWAYEQWDRMSLKEGEHPKIEEAIEQLRSGNMKKESLFYNSFESILLKEFPEIRDVFSALEKLGLQPAVSGSGSAVYSILSDASDREKINFELEKKGFNIFFAKTVKPGVSESH